MNKPLVLVVEDDGAIRNLITTTLETRDYKYCTAENGGQAIMETVSRNPEVMLLDLGLPDMDGLDIIKQVREWAETPIVVISARTQEKEKVAALDLGADDYITKPFGTDELMARIRTALRHHDKVKAGNSSEKYQVEGLEIDFGKRLVMLEGQSIHLTQIEYKLITLLAKNAGKVLTYDHIMKEIWGPYAGDDNQILRVNMANIRRKLEKNPAEPKYIFTEVGVGYRMQEDR